MDVMYQRIFEELARAGKTQKELAEYLGIKQQAITNWKQRLNTSYTKYIHGIADFLGVSVAYLKGETDVKEKSPAPLVTDDVVCFPVLGDVAAGFEHVALTDWEGATAEFPRSALRGRPAEDYLALRVCGDSMYPFYLDGDVVLVLRTPSLEHDGQVALIRYDGENATLKKVEQLKDGMRLIPLNPIYPPRTISGVDLEQCSIIGIPRLLLRNVE
ncbi:MAG: helix-turn-helix domain-containing protein [Clostridia bacterium]|nr:helix-turn-helix domain-containing protein [Clostridia bacterium]